MVTKRIWIIFLALLMMGCLNLPADDEQVKTAPLPPEIGRLYEMYGDPQVFPGTAMTLVWDFGSVRLHIHLSYDPFIGWAVSAYQIAGTATVPSEFELLMYMAAKKMEDREVPRDPWGNPITDRMVLHPELRKGW